MSAAFLCLWAIAAQGSNPEVTVKPLAGEGMQGRLTELAAGKIALQTPAGASSLSAAELMWLEFPRVQPAETKPAVWIDLGDGSKLLASGYTAASGKARIQLTSGATLEIPTRTIHTVRFRQQGTSDLAAQWREIASSMAAGDLLVVRKTSTRQVDQGENQPATVTEHALDQLEGTLHEVTAETVRFEIDGEKVDVRREKLEGLVYYHPARREIALPACRVIDTGGSVWQIRDLRLSGEKLAATTAGGVSLELPIDRVAKIDFSVGNVLFLAEAEPDSGDGELSVSLQPAGMTYKFGRIFQVRPGPPLGSDAFRIGGVRFDSGLSLHSPLTLVYRVPEGFRWFRAVAGIDDSIVAPGRFDLVILGDGRELFRHSFSSGQPRRPLPIDLDIATVRRISIVLDPADGHDIGDQLNLCEARFTK